MTIRRIPTDFVVVEELSPEWTPLATRPSRAPHAIYQVIKTSLTTPQAADALARALGVRPAHVSHAGLKDKHAHTRQHLAVAWPRESAPPPTAQEPRWNARFLGWLDRPLRAQAIERNRFEIIARDLRPHEVDLAWDRAQALNDPRDGSILLINYFGDQRFGSARHGKGFAAAHLIRGDFETALRLLIATPHRKDAGRRRDLTRALASHWSDWSRALDAVPPCPERGAVEHLAAGGSFADAFARLPYDTRQWCVESYQSHLWNAAARHLVASLNAPGTLDADDDFGVMRFPPAFQIPGEWRTLAMPVPSPQLGTMSDLAAPIRDALEEALREESCTLRDLRIPGQRRPEFGVASRPLVAPARDFSLDRDEDALARRGRLAMRLRFSLPRGSYATVLLRALGQ